jgi:hypothetical protein
MSSLSGRLWMPGSAGPDYSVEDNQKLPQNIFELVLHTIVCRFIVCIRTQMMFDEEKYFKRPKR